MSSNLGGIEQLHSRRALRARQAPQPRHPKLGAAASLDDQQRPAAHAAEPDATEQTSMPPAAQPSSRPADPSPQTPVNPEAPPAAPATGPGESTVDGAAAAREDRPPTDEPAPMPQLDIDPADPTAQLVSPTVLSIPASIVKRFERARAHAPSHTALVLDALRAHAHELPDLIISRRPGPKPGDLFPFREAPGRTTQDTPLPVRIRPTKGELAVMKALTDWISATIAKQRPGTRETNRSEMVAAALDAFLPATPERRKQPTTTSSSLAQSEHPPV
ncbi:hypothetical protein MOKP76_15510 [Mycobacterium avium subsp. hominissuis]